MNKLYRIGLALTGGLLFTGASALDTSGPLLCASIEVNECVDGSGCDAVLAEEVNAPTFFRIDMKKKQVRVTKDGPPTTIERVEEVDGRIVMQGVEDGSPNLEDGTGWTISIEKDTARMVATAATLQAAIVIFGACTEQL